VDLAVIVPEMTLVLRRLIGEDIVLDVRPSPVRCTVIADPVEVEQVLVNLVVNAVDAMPTGGRLEIGLAATGGAWVMLRVRDSGLGIAPDVLPRIFEPFFTTKQQGHGTGLGLATVHGIVTKAGGRIEVDSEEGQGTEFRVYLPAADHADDEVRLARPSHRHRGQGRVLLVEDDSAVRALARRVLEAQGYRVVEVGTPAQVLELMDSSDGDAIDLLIADLVMPGMSGPEVAQAVRKRLPDVPTIFVSGYTPEEVMRKGIDVREARFLAKPFSINELLEQVHAALRDRVSV